MNHLEVGRKMQQIRGQYGYGYKKTGWVCLQNISDYSPFGAPLDGRTIQSDFYRRGFNGQEKTDEISGSGNHTTATFWEYDTRLGRRWNTDHVVKEWESPYSCFRNNPIYFIDHNGSDGIVTVKLAEPLTKGKKIYQGGTIKNPNQMTVKANYYYNAKDINGIGGQKSLDDAVSAYNNSEHTILGEDGKYYKVKFEITAIPVEESDPQEMLRNNTKKDNAGDGMTYETHFPFGNIIACDIPGMSEGIDKNELGSASFNQISLRSKGINDAVARGADREISLFNIFIHEIGHNLGGAHSDGGALNGSTTKTTESGISINGSSSSHTSTIKNKLTPENVKSIVGTINGGGRSSERPGRVKKVN